ncbi:uncharacterized protein PSFLO_02445 [Pseudozyma flocculosa]|uniref:Uncharacterized protein n=2 Tax=Pseudozyma flocculosa TaxID=84751 RepID=A0A5C3EXG9_9BASI|nr:uncharacterized protein PSFLO_02445 [Pseudozyma flocculosa]
MDALAGHPKAIRIAGRRMSQSGNNPIKSPNAAKGPTPSTSPEDHVDDIHMRTPADYPRPKDPNEAEEHQQQQQPPLDDDESNKDRRRKREDGRKKGMSSEEARLRKMEAPAVLGKGGPGRRMSGSTAGVRISQPAGKMMS